MIFDAFTYSIMALVLVLAIAIFRLTFRKRDCESQK